MKANIVIGLNTNSTDASEMMERIDDALTDAFGYGATLLNFEYANLGHDNATLVECDGIERSAVETAIANALAPMKG